jgi:hypothetical protein
MGKNLRLLLRMEPDDVRQKYFGDLGDLSWAADADGGSESSGKGARRRH